jgi:TetR/AcrR family fatty acid metabolism transcriptional regulator
VPGSKSRTRRDPASFEAKRRAILQAATRVFAAKGFTGTRVGDIAAEAGIAYGLIYHYFKNKEAVLHALFQETWGLSLKVVEGVEQGEGTLDDKLRAIAGFFLEAWNLQPAIVEVVMREVLRSPKFLETEHLQAFKELFTLLERIFETHAAELRPDVEPRLTAFLFLGSLELLLTGFVARELLGDDAGTVQNSRDALVDTFLRGIVRA